MNELGELTFEMLDLKILQLVLMVMASTLTCYLLIRLTFWIFDYVNTKFLNISSTGLTCLNSLTMDKTNIYLQFSDFTTGDCTNLYLGTIFGNPEDIYVCGQFVSGRITLDKKFPHEFHNSEVGHNSFKSDRLGSTNAHYPPNFQLAKI